MISIEAILNQVNSVYVKSLTEAVYKLQKESTMSSRLLADSGITTIIKDMTGIPLKLGYLVNNPLSAYIVVPKLSNNHPLINDLRRNRIATTDFYHLIKQSGKILTGTVNIKTGKVTGIFTDIVNEMHIGKAFFESNKFSPEETVAVMLHEVGHIFTYYEHIASTTRLNTVLSAIENSDYKNAPTEKRIIMLHEVDKELGIKIPDKELNAGGNDSITQIVIMKEEVEHIRSEMGCMMYDLRAYEYLSDQFAARYGMGTPLATAIAKLNHYGNSINNMRAPTYFVIELLKYISYSAGLFGGLMLMRDLAACARGSDYDRPKDRVRRLREQLVVQLKDRTISDEQRNQLLSDISMIDTMVDEMVDRITLIQLISKYVTPWGRASSRGIKLQQDYEQLVNNDLYVKAASYKRGLRL